jgi:hypothetical protein
MNESIVVNFIGPFSWLGTEDSSSIFDSPESHKKGIYLWAVNIEAGYLIYYVGITARSFSERMKEHLKEHFAGFYHLNKSAEFKKGIRKPIWPGMYDVEKKISLIELASHHAILSGEIYELAKIYRFFIAPIDNDKRLIERTESALANHLYQQEGIVGTFQEKGIRYRPRLQTEKPLFASFKAPANILGLPERLEI